MDDLDCKQVPEICLQSHSSALREVCTPDEASREISSILIFIKYPNLTFTYYFEEYLSRIQGVPIFVKVHHERLNEVRPIGLFIMMCRYISNRQMRWKESNRRSWEGAINLLVTNREKGDTAVLGKDEENGRTGLSFLAASNNKRVSYLRG